MESPAPPKKNALINRAVDFWFLGGISMVAWLLSQAAVYGFNLNEGFDRQIMNWPYAFSALSLVCNYPHFISSYRIAYGSGRKKILNQWFTLLVVPIGLIALFYSAYQMRQKPFEHAYWNSFFKTDDLGSSLLRVGVWTMWLTVGWHYAKQSFGVMLKVAGYDHYPLTKLHRNLLKYALLAIVPPNFIVMISQMSIFGAPDFQDLPMTVFSIPHWVTTASFVVTAVSGFLFLASVVQIYVQHKRLPSINFMTPFVAFYLWWFPGFWPIPYSMIMVPFFHSLQYLPFAYKRLEGELSERSRKRFSTVVTLNVIGIILVGAFLFDLLPAWLDAKADSRITFGSSFFVIALLLFFNIHHFFVDSSIWKSRKA